ncbi:MAG: GNAT family N-acetyltransferase [Chloroflexota bacterium]|nr:GNAT family N-acetyltransferase [Chloroflexota bacterium]
MKSTVMAVTFRDITRDNFEQVIALEIGDDQQGFVRSNLYSIAQSKAIPVLTPKAIYNEEEDLVGFVLYRGERDPDQDPDGWLVRIMIDKRYQGRGYGRRAMEEIIRLVRDDRGCRSIGLSVEPKNRNAR